MNNSNKNSKEINSNLKYRTICEVMIYILTIYTIIFPRDILNIKEIMLFITLLLGISAIKNKMLEKDNFVFVFFSIIYPLMTIVFSIFLGESSLTEAITGGYVWIFLFLIPIIKYYELDIKKPFFIATTVIALMIDLIFLLDFFNILSIYNNWIIYFFDKFQEIQFGKGTSATFGYSIFFKASPLIIYTYAYALKNKKWIWTLVLLLAFFASGTRANLISAIILVPMVLIVSEPKYGKKIKLLIILSIIATLFLPNIIFRINNLNQIKKNRGDSIKNAAIETIINSIRKEPINYVFGTGIGSSFYFAARGKNVNVVEVSYLDYIRQVGFVGFFIFLLFILIPIKKIKKNDRWVLFAYIMYLAVAATNPLLVTSTSFIGYVLVFSGELMTDNKALI